MIKVIGITGGVGSGKSFVLDYLRRLPDDEPDGYLRDIETYVIEADRVAFDLQQPGQPCYDEMVKEFGEGILSPDGTIHRKILGDIVFSDEKKLEKLNQIVHPFVKKHIIQTIETIRQKQESARRPRECGMASAYVFIEAALLIEDHYDVICDELWYIYVREDLRRKRLQAQRGYSQEKITQIMARQLREEDFRRCCQAVIDNNGSIEHTFQQIREELSCQNR